MHPVTSSSVPYICIDGRSAVRPRSRYIDIDIHMPDLCIYISGSLDGDLDILMINTLPLVGSVQR